LVKNSSNAWVAYTCAFNFPCHSTFKYVHNLCST
jgi:hypothetical protein